MDPNRKSIAELAYQLWEARGRPHGTAEVDWHEAERQLSEGSAATPRALDAKVEESVVGTFRRATLPLAIFPTILRAMPTPNGRPPASNENNRTMLREAEFPESDSLSARSANCARRVEHG